uniref:Uncharacterized protein n=1 Tax=Octopus bimaculoides TaxID=37653 RepID=A0A0L8GYE8_OCTBM
MYIIGSRTSTRICAHTCQNQTNTHTLRESPSPLFSVTELAIGRSSSARRNFSFAGDKSAGVSLFLVSSV